MKLILFLTKRPVSVALLIALCFSPVQSHAILSSSAPVGTGTTVKGCCTAACAYTIGRIATYNDARKAFKWIDKTLKPQVKKMGQAYVTGDNKVQALINKRFEAQNATFRPLFAGYGAAREANKNRKIFGPGSMAYATWDRKDSLTGDKADNAIDVRLRQQAKEYAESFEGPKQRAGRLSEVEVSDLNPRHVFPAGGTLTKEQGSKLLVALETIIDSFPVAEVSESRKDSPGGKAYRSVQKIQRFRAQIAEAALSEIMSGYMPTVPVGEGVRKMWDASGGEGDPAKMEDDHISPVGFLGFLVHSRFANDEYRTGESGIHAMPPAGLLREVASVKALRMAIKERQLRRSQQIAFMAALQTSGKAAVKSLELQEVLSKTLED